MKLTDQLMAELQRLKLSPMEDGNKIIFSYEGVKYMYCDMGMDGYLYFMTFIADIEDCERLEVYKAINEVNLGLHFAKCFLKEKTVLATYEFWTGDDAKLEFVILNALSTLSAARSNFLSGNGQREIGS